MRISTSANVVAIALIGLVGLMVSFQIYGITTMRALQQQERLASGVTNAVLDLASLVNEMQTRSNPRVEQQFANRVASLEDLLDELAGHETIQLSLIYRMQKTIGNISDAVEGMAGLESDSAAATTLRHSFLASSHALASLAKRLSTFHARQIAAVEGQVLTGTVATALGILALIIAVYVLFVVGVMSPLLGFRDRIAKIAADESPATPGEFGPNNELRQISDEFDRRYAIAQAVDHSLRVHAAELERSNRDLETFAYAASHDLRSPLRGIMTTAAWIKEDFETGITSETRGNLELLMKRAKRLDDLLNSLLDYSRTAMASKDNADLADVDIGNLFDDVVVLIAPPAGFRVEREGPMPVIKAVEVLLQRVLQNLIDNAIKHHDQDEGRVVLRSEDAGDLIRLTITDDGPGIDAKYHDQVVQIFKSLQRKDVTESSGVGLAMVKKIVEQAGGTLTIESLIEDGRGCAVSFTWPRTGETTSLRPPIETDQ